MAAETSRRADFTYGGHDREGLIVIEIWVSREAQEAEMPKLGCRDPENRPPREADAGQLVQAQGPCHTGQSDIGRHGRSSRQGIFGDYSANDLDRRGSRPRSGSIAPNAPETNLHAGWLRLVSPRGPGADVTEMADLGTNRDCSGRSLTSVAT